MVHYYHQRGEDWEEGGLVLEYDREAETTWGGVDITQGVKEIQGVPGTSVRLVAAQKVVGWEPRQRLERAGIQVNTRELD